ncbi:hypothetical protein GCM10009117_19900 [Gangjinia marincola]|uniref:Plasmid stabilization system protein n=1 Tax=Gangjinia marincola TaxID=578463 RepID=A0ABP3XX30_9FLAO
MVFEISLTPRAEEEINDAIDWYEGKKIGLGADFYHELVTEFNYIRTYPMHCPVKRDNFREAVINRFPFIIMFRIIEEQLIIYSVFNTYRNPKSKPR